jgi:hypothetical protein
MRLGRFTPTHVARRFVVGAGRGTVALATSIAARDTPPRDVVDERRVPIGEALLATAYWIDRPEVGRGRGVSVFWRDQELMRIDLFDVGPHVHYGLAQMRALDAAGSSVRLSSADADRAVFELEHNLRYAIGTHPSRRVRNIEIEPNVLALAAEQLREELLDLAKTHNG